jgi:membrane protease YdiL (CAAX protease family)
MVCLQSFEGPWVETSQKVQLKALILILVSILVVEWLEKVIVTRTPYDPMIILGAARILQVILILLIVVIWGNGLDTIGLDLPRILFGIKKGLIWSFGFGILAFVAFLVLFMVGIDPLPMIKMPMSSDITQFIILICIGGILAPVAEEVFFRGVLYGFFRRWGMIVALIVSTFLFVVVHPMGQGIPVIQIVGGIIFAVAYEVEGTLMTPITIHALGNCSLFTVSFLT